MRWLEQKNVKAQRFFLWSKNMTGISCKSKDEHSYTNRRLPIRIAKSRRDNSLDERIHRTQT
ncbi:hypothetical protein LBK6_11515 [Leptospira borgpetersenii serovar Hardjo]|nr:hypothetical protein LBK6_11515 [Leptospira borgpetersenii serovar Hardjo]AWV70725.1 hypothetical protein B9T54_12430 [Leptospira borgpetersenii serovar Hardjo-bovis]TQE53989.1 hypothetical protein FFZ95_05620 [Leptospira borgpetersenii]AMX62195.1 hypothetical protein LBK9_11560 [Leptospira borgpetersenii serovar Hardjo]AMX65438.1 hypothetical protein LBK30_11580 [Leptospira borgpetersenii serovar Hardjo]